MSKINRIINLLSPILRPAGFIYGQAMEKRRQQYKCGARQSYKPKCPTISVGNISWGGTGKTPFTSFLLNWAAQKNLQATVLTRGYGGKPGSSPLLVDHKTTLPGQSGDEPLLLAQQYPKAKIVVFPERKKSTAFAEEHWHSDLFILDDGMQHLKIKRDLDIVLLSPQDLTSGWNKVIPGGTWREPASALATADCFAIKASLEELKILEPAIQKHLSFFKKPLFSFTLVPQKLIRIEYWSTNLCQTAHEFAGKPENFILCSGVGNPQQVLKTAEVFMGKAPIKHFIFPDHHQFTADDTQKLLEQGLPVICTAKDAVKLVQYKDHFKHTPLLVMDISLRFGKTIFNEETFVSWFEQWWTTQADKNDQT